MLITVAEALTQIPSLKAGSDTTLIEGLISQCGGAFARWCGYPPAASPIATPTMESVSYTRYLDGPGGRDLVLDVWPATAITSIADDPTLDFASSAYVVTASDYTLLEGHRGLVRLKSTSSKGAFSSTKGAIKAVFTAGYGTTPGDLKLLVKQGVRHAYDLRATQGKQNVSKGSGSESKPGDDDFLPPLVRQGLSLFKLPRAWL